MASNQTTIEMEVEPLKPDTPVKVPDNDQTEINVEGDSDQEQQKEVSGDDEESGQETDGEGPSAENDDENKKV